LDIAGWQGAASEKVATDSWGSKQGSKQSVAAETPLPRRHNDGFMARWLAD